MQRGGRGLSDMFGADIRKAFADIAGKLPGTPETRSSIDGGAADAVRAAFELGKTGNGNDQDRQAQDGAPGDGLRLWPRAAHPPEGGQGPPYGV